MFIVANDSGTTVIGCCGEAVVEDREEVVAGDMEQLRKFVEKNPDANLTVLAQRVNQDWGVGKVRFTLAFSNRPKKVAKLIGIRSELLVGFYADEGRLVQHLILRAS
jgi:hypothetical protein